MNRLRVEGFVNAREIAPGQVDGATVEINLGGIGKGYAVDCVAELLREWSINVALISGGYSSVLALDAPPGKKGF